MWITINKIVLLCALQLLSFKQKGCRCRHTHDPTDGLMTRHKIIQGICSKRRDPVSLTEIRYDITLEN